MAKKKEVQNSYIKKKKKKKIRPSKKRSLLQLTRPNVFWSADRVLFGAAPCVASCAVDRDREREAGK